MLLLRRYRASGAAGSNSKVGGTVWSHLQIFSGEFGHSWHLEGTRSGPLRHAGHVMFL